MLPSSKAKWIEECINIIKKNKKISAIVPVIEFNDHHPLRAKKLKKGFLKTYVAGRKKVPSNRQDLEKAYFLCHNFWLIKTNEIKKILVSRHGILWAKTLSLILLKSISMYMIGKICW